ADEAPEGLTATPGLSRGMGRGPSGPSGHLPMNGEELSSPPQSIRHPIHPTAIHSTQKKAPSLRSGLFWFSNLGYADALGARALGARLDFELDLLATLEAVEVAFGATAVEKVFLSVLCLDKSKATIRNEFL